MIEKIQGTPPPKAHPELGTIAAHVDRRLVGDERVQVVEHLAGCSECYEVYAETLKLDMKPPGKEVGQTLQFPAAGLETLRRESLRDEPFRPSCQAMLPIGVRRDLFPGDACLAFGLVERSGGQEPAEILVTSPILDEKSQTGRIES